VPISPQHGPPRRPIQSRHALWVGNIPSHTPILALRDHFFTPDNAHDILSVVFTPSSNSGFINFRSGEACKASMRRFNKSFLYGVPLNCRARKPSLGPGSQSRHLSAHSSSISSSLLESPVSSTGPFSNNSDEVPDSKPLATKTEQVDVAEAEIKERHKAASTQDVISGLESLSVTEAEGKNRYFIIKSLTYDDLLNSVKSRRWSTQIQNESFLNNAYKVKGQNSRRLVLEF
jgi:hypothetical protein